jgi:hypothetical protein
MSAIWREYEDFCRGLPAPRLFNAKAFDAEILRPSGDNGSAGGSWLVERFAHAMPQPLDLVLNHQFPAL